MAIQPIDLQAIFSQVDKVGKNQAFMRDGQHIQETLQQAQIQRRLEENVQSVNEAQEMGDETEKIKDDRGRGALPGKGDGRGKQEEEEEGMENDSSLIRDPSLGRLIDISG